jgi:hypothetical protein
MSNSVTECEREVEIARAKLTRDLSTLRSPETFSSFIGELKAEAFEAKDVVVEHAKEAVRTSAEGFIEDLKARAAANPAAALAIGAGIAWRVLRHPPITSLLVGAGVFSLWRTSPPQFYPHENKDYLDRGKQRLGEQVKEFGADASKVAAEAGRVLIDKAGEAYESASGAVEDWSQRAADGVGEFTLRTSEKAQGGMAAARDTIRGASDQAAVLGRLASLAARNVASDTARSMTERARTVPSFKADTRDRILLGVAGFAVAGALGIAFQKRMAEERPLETT